MTQHVARFERVSQGAPKSTDLEFAGGRLMESVMCPLSGFRKMLQIHSDCFRVQSCDLITSYYIILHHILHYITKRLHLFLEITKSSVTLAIQDSRLLLDSVESFGTPGCGRKLSWAKKCKEDKEIQRITKSKSHFMFSSAK